MRIQNKSQGFKYGDSREKPLKDFIIQFWADYSHPRFGNWIIDTEWIEHYSPKFISDNKMVKEGYTFFAHTPDIAFFEWIEDRPVLRLVIEVDGESHDAKSRKKADGLFQEWLGIHYKGYCKLIRLQKRELTGPRDLVLEYLKDELQEFIK